MAKSGGETGYQKYGWVILFVSDVLGPVAALLLTFAPFQLVIDPSFRAGNTALVLRGWGITWLGFSAFAL